VAEAKDYGPPPILAETVAIAPSIFRPGSFDAEVSRFLTVVLAYLADLDD